MARSDSHVSLQDAVYLGNKTVTFAYAETQAAVAVAPESTAANGKAAESENVQSESGHEKNDLNMSTEAVERSLSNTMQQIENTEQPPPRTPESPVANDGSEDSARRGVPQKLAAHLQPRSNSESNSQLNSENTKVATTSTCQEESEDMFLDNEIVDGLDANVGDGEEVSDIDDPDEGRDKDADYVPDVEKANEQESDGEAAANNSDGNGDADDDDDDDDLEPEEEKGAPFVAVPKLGARYALDDPNAFVTGKKAIEKAPPVSFNFFCKQSQVELQVELCLFHLQPLDELDERSAPLRMLHSLLPCNALDIPSVQDDKVKLSALILEIRMWVCIGF